MTKKTPEKTAARRLQQLAVAEFFALPPYQLCHNLARTSRAEAIARGEKPPTPDELYPLVKDRLRPKGRPEKKDKAT